MLCSTDHVMFESVLVDSIIEIQMVSVGRCTQYIYGTVWYTLCFLNDLHFYQLTALFYFLSCWSTYNSISYWLFSYSASVKPSKKLVTGFSFAEHIWFTRPKRGCCHDNAKAVGDIGSIPRRGSPLLFSLLWLMMLSFILKLSKRRRFTFNVPLIFG